MSAFALLLYRKHFPLQKFFKMRKKGVMANLLTANCQRKVNLFAYGKNLLNFFVFYEEKFNKT